MTKSQYCKVLAGIVHFSSMVHLKKRIKTGLQGSEVVFQGDRLESEYSEIPGQWGIQLDCPISTSIGPSVASIIRGGIWIFAGKDNEINYAIFKNGNIGIQVDTTSANFDGGNYALKIQNTKILNTVVS